MRRVLQVGAGGFGRRWSAVLTGSRAMGIELAGLVDTDPSVLAARGGELGLDESQRFVSLGAALEAVRPEIVVCVTPPSSHADVAIAALEAGSHVLVEKPLAPSMEEAERMALAAERTGRRLAVSQNYRYEPHAMAVREVLRSGRLGEPESFTASFHRGPRGEISYRKSMRYPLLVDMSIHHYDLMRFFLGREPEWTFAKSFNPPWSWFEGDASVAQVIGFAGGAVGAYSASWCAQARETPWGGEWRFDCTGGVVEWKDGRVVLEPVGGTMEEVPPVNAVYHGQEAVLAGFLEALDSGRDFETDVRDNLRSLNMVFRTIQACESGSVVRF